MVSDCAFVREMSGGGMMASGTGVVRAVPYPMHHATTGVALAMRSPVRSGVHVVGESVDLTGDDSDRGLPHG